MTRVHVLIAAISPGRLARSPAFLRYLAAAAAEAACDGPTLSQIPVQIYVNALPLLACGSRHEWRQPAGLMGLDVVLTAINKANDH